jgi:glycosyltransferase involved in cell wall biosynthesis
MTKTILYVDNRTKYVCSHRIPWLQGAKQAGFDVHVTTLTAGDPSGIRDAGFTYHPISEQGRSNNPIHEAQLIARLYQLYQDLKPDLVHHITLRSILYGGIASSLLRGPKVVNGVTGLGYLFSSRDLQVHLMRKAVLWAVRALTREEHVFIFQNPDDEQLFQAHNVVRPAASVLIKGSGVNMERFEQKPVPPGTPVVLFPARMLWHKGVQEFVDAARQVKAQGQEARFVMVGSIDADNPAGVPADQLKNWEDEGIIEWWGYQESMPEVFAQANIVCLPSAYREGVPKVLIEAASCGRPIVTTDMPGCREIVRDGENGHLVPPRDANAVAEAITHLLENPQQRLAMGQEGRELVRREFSIEHVVRSTLDVYESVLATSKEETSDQFVNSKPQVRV